MKILIKYPTRGRPTWFFKTLDLYWRKLSGRHEVKFLVAMDEDDVTMNCDLVKDYLAQIAPEPACSFNLEWFYAEHEGKVAAVNSGIAEQEFDIMFVISEDIVPTADGYDDIIANAFLQYYPDTDGLIYFNDGRCGQSRIPIPIMGRKFFDRFGWVVHPDFIAWGDNHLTKLWKATGKVRYFPQELLLHEWRRYIPRDKKGRRIDATALRAKHKKTVDARTAIILDKELKGE